MTSPTLTVIAGANGCGKSTLTKWARALFQQTATLDPDAIAVEFRSSLIFLQRYLPFSTFPLLAST